MSPDRLRLMAWVLNLYVDRQISRGCDDLDWPEWYPVDDRELLVREMARANGSDAIDTEDSVRMYATGTMCPPAWWLGGFLAEKVLNER